MATQPIPEEDPFAADRRAWGPDEFEIIPPPQPEPDDEGGET